MKNWNRYLAGVMLSAMSFASLLFGETLPLPSDPPKDFLGPAEEQLTKHKQYIASVEYKVARQLEYAAKEQDLSAAMNKCIEFINNTLAATEKEGEIIKSLGLLEVALREKLADAEKKLHERGDDKKYSKSIRVDFSEKDAAVKECSMIREKYNMLRKRLEQIKEPVFEISERFKDGGSETRKQSRLDTLEELNTWCIWVCGRASKK